MQPFARVVDKRRLLLLERLGHTLDELKVMQVQTVNGGCEKKAEMNEGKTGAKHLVGRLLLGDVLELLEEELLDGVLSRRRRHATERNARNTSKHGRKKGKWPPHFHCGFTKEFFRFGSVVKLAWLPKITLPRAFFFRSLWS